MQAIALEEAETKIRTAVKDEYFKSKSKAAIDKAIFPIIRDALKEITIPSLKSAAQKSLLNFYDRQYRELLRSFGWQFSLFTAVMLLNNRTPYGAKIKATEAQRGAAVQILEGAGYTPPRVMGVPLQKFTEYYVRQNVQPALDRLAKQFALDPEDESGRNSLRNKAEMEVRFAAQREQLENFRASGVKLVICSTHADCSERCRRWQGLVYSLDGTYGMTDDGRKYQPLENATDIYYTTKAGKTYKNGLLGFNCRHFLVPYKNGYRFLKPNVAYERREYAITEEQRKLERQVRKWRTIAVEAKGQNPKRYKFAKAKAEAYNKAYIDFSMKHDRAYYPSRTKLI